MISPVTKEISGFSVHFRPLPATKAFELAMRVGCVALPLLKCLDLENLKKEVDVSRLLDTAVEAVTRLAPSDAVAIVVESLKGCTITAPGSPAVDISSTSDVDVVFQGELDAMYEIVLESWKYNKLGPFKLAARFGFQMNKTDTSGAAASTGTKRGTKLAM